MTKKQNLHNLIKSEGLHDFKIRKYLILKRFRRVLDTGKPLGQGL